MTWGTKLETLDQVACGSNAIATATVTLNDMSVGEDFTDAATGTGPVDAAFQAVNRLLFPRIS